MTTTSRLGWSAGEKASTLRLSISSRGHAAEEFSFAVETSEDMVEPADTGPGGIIEMLDFGDATSVGLSLQSPRPFRTKRLSALAANEDVKAGERVTFRVEFLLAFNAIQAIKAAGRWQPS